MGEAAGEEGKPILAFALGGLASAMRVVGDYEALSSLLEQYFAALAVHQNLPAISARLLAAVIAAGWEHRAWEWPATRLEFEQAIALVRTQLGEAEFEREQAAGRALSLEQSVEYARQLQIRTETALQSKDKLGDLTERESEVAVLIAQGKTNREIAQDLVLSKRTVEKHAANILSKLELASRALIVRWAIEKGLVQASE